MEQTEDLDFIFEIAEAPISKAGQSGMLVDEEAAGGGSEPPAGAILESDA